MKGRTAIMGIVNVTPDSFSDGGKYLNSESAIAHGIKLAEEGADLIDIGGESTRPGAIPVSVYEEMARILPVVRGLRRALSIPLSVDTCKAEVARAALAEGADLVNDISALRFDAEMVTLIAKEKTPVILMHMQGKPRDMQVQPRYSDVVEEVKSFLVDRARFAVQRGVPQDRIMIDPGIGFGKNLCHNLALLRALPVFASLGFPVVVGASRKSFLGKILELGLEDRREGSVAAAVAAALGGASMVRVHDVKESWRALRVADAIRFGVMPAE
ncbi:MAG: dihydropteroate synthase [Deltaproteobacteria bacterium]|nr:dihydropteroate synthase [Deltaproteobacteria bacterium]